MSDDFGSISIDSAKKNHPLKKSGSLPPSLSPQRKKQSAKTLFFPIIIFVFIAFYFLAGTYLAPKLLQKYLTTSLLKIGLNFTVESIHLNPLNFQLTLKNSTVTLPGDKAPLPLLRTGSVFMDLDLTSLLRNGFVCDSLQVRNLQMHLIRQKDKRYNLPDSFHLRKEETHGDIIDFAQLPFLFSLNNITIDNSRILFQDKISNKTHTIEKLNVSIPSFSNFSFQSQNYIKPHFSAIINGSPIQLSGEAVQLANSQSFQTTLTCAIQSLELAPYFSYLPSSFPLVLSNGKADTTLQIIFAPEKKKGSRLHVTFTLNATDIKMEAKSREYTITIPALQIQGNVEPFAGRVHLKSIVAKNPLIQNKTKSLKEDTLKFLAYFSPDRKHPQLAIDMFLVDQGHLISSDKNRTDSWDALQLSITDFKTANWLSGTQSPVTGILRVSGEEKNGNGSFSWQAKFAEFGKLQGKLLLNNVPASTVFSIIKPDSAAEIRGNSAFTADLIFFPWEEKESRYTLHQGSLQINNLEIAADSRPFLKSTSLHMPHIEKNRDQLHLGNIFLKEANLVLHKNQQLPEVINDLSSNEKLLQCSGIDFTGSVEISANGTSATTLSLANVHFQANNLDTSAPPDLKAEMENFAFSANLGDEGIIKARGAVHFFPFKLHSDIAFSEIKTALPAIFFPDQLLLQNSHATLHGKGVYDYADSQFTGTLRVTDALLQRFPQKPLLLWKTMEASSIQCTFSPLQIRAATFLLDTAAFQWKLTQGNSNPFQQIQKGLADLLHNDNQENKRVPFSVQEIHLQNCSVSILDQRLTPPWSATVESLSGKLKNFNTVDSVPSAFDLFGKIADAPFTLSGAAGLFASAGEGRAILQLKDFPLSTFQAQLSSLAVNTDSATLDLQMKISQQEQTLNSNAELLVKNLSPEQWDSDTALPLALLKNTEGNFPITLHLENNSPSLFQDSIDHFRTLVIKGSYAPLLLDQNFLDLQQKNRIVFLPGTNTISPEGYETLSRYAELLKSHPSLAFSLTGLTDRKNDQTVLQQVKEKKEQQRVDSLNARNRKEFLARQQEKGEQLSSDLKRQENIMQATILPQYIPIEPTPLHVSDDELLNLAEDRALIVFDYFRQSLGISASQISLSENDHIDETDNGSHVLINLKTLFPATEN